MKLVWPQESPVDGEFGEKKEISDRATLAVLKEKQQHGVALTIGAADAREKLVDYGRPAPKYLRTTATPPIAGAFHRFLLSLYDSLEAAALPPDNTPVRQP